MYEFLKRRIDRVFSAENGLKALELFKEIKPDIVISDIKMPVMDGINLAAKIKKIDKKIPVILATAFSETSYLIRAIEIGVDKYMPKPVDGRELLEAIESLIIPKFQAQKIEELSNDINSALEKALGNSDAMKDIIKKIRQISKMPVSVIMEGETGVGKSYLAKIIHSFSKFSNGPFISVDIGSLPESLVESELFGYEKGAFTGAEKNKKGYFELAHNGTLFIDELQNMSKSVQSKILKAVEEKRIVPVGGEKPVPVNLRIIGASNKNLSEEIAKGNFREDLFYRLNEFYFVIPPLRDRKDDIISLADKFIMEANDEFEAKISGITEDGALFLKSQQWKGNIRELRNIIRKACMISDENQISENILKPLLIQSVVTKNETVKADFSCSKFIFYADTLTIDDMEKQLIEKALAVAAGKKTKAASLLGIDYKTLLARSRKYGIE